MVYNGFTTSITGQGTILSNCWIAYVTELYTIHGFTISITGQDTMHGFTTIY
jgi:hypothetical protein